MGQTIPQRGIMLTTALFLAILNKTLVDYLAAPARKRFPDLDLWWLVYLSLATGILIGWLSQANLFIEVMPDVVTGRILTSVLIGGGASLIHDIFEGVLVTLNKPPVQLQYSTESQETPADKVAKEQILEQVKEQK